MAGKYRKNETSRNWIIDKQSYDTGIIRMI